MTTDLVETCARAISDEIDQQVHGDGSKSVESLDLTGIVRAVIDALADGVTPAMVSAASNAIYPSRWHEKRENEMRRALSAAIRAAKSREGNGNG